MNDFWLDMSLNLHIFHGLGHDQPIFSNWKGNNTKIVSKNGLWLPYPFLQWISFFLAKLNFVDGP